MAKRIPREYLCELCHRPVLGLSSELVDGAYYLCEPCRYLGTQLDEMNARAQAIQPVRTSTDGWNFSSARDLGIHAHTSELTPDGNGAYCQVCGETTG